MGIDNKYGRSEEVIPMSSRDLLVSEIFGPTFQGEGPSTGRLCAFLRLGGCNLHCSWCDTPYTWAFDERHANFHESGRQYDPKVELRRMSNTDVIRDLKKVVPSWGALVVISGGEPLLQQDQVAALINEMNYNIFEIETAGTIHVKAALAAQAYRIHFNVSPKLQHSGNSLKERRNWPALQSLATYDSIFKFVVSPETLKADLLEIKTIALELNLDAERIWIMPVGTTRDEQLQRMEVLAPIVLDEGWNLTPRLHTLIWGNERGK